MNSETVRDIKVKNMGNKKHLEFNMCHEFVVTFSPEKASFFRPGK